MYSEKIKKVCQDKNISIRDLAKEIGMSFSGLYASLNNDTLKVSTLIQIADVLKMPVINFFGVRKTLDEMLGNTFLDNETVILLSKRHDKFMDQISFIKDFYVLSVMNDIQRGKIPTSYAKDQEGNNINLLTQSEYDTLFDVGESLSSTPFSKWKSGWRDYVLGSHLLDEFYRVIFDTNYLNVREYLSDGFIKDTEILRYWNKYSKQQLFT